MTIDPTKKTREEELDNLFAPKGIKRSSSSMASEQVNMVQAPDMAAPKKVDAAPPVSGTTAAMAQEAWKAKSQEERNKLGYIEQPATSLPATSLTPTEKAKQLIAEGEEPFLALMQKSKPQKDEDKEKRLKKAGRLSAIVNALSTIAGGLPAIAGGSARGYAPQVDRSEEPFISQLNQLEEDFKTAEKDYQQLEISARMQDLQRRLELQQAEQEKADRKAERAEEREYAKSTLDEQRQYEKERYEQQLADKRAEQEYQLELGNMYAAITEGHFDGDYDDWQALPAKERNAIVKKTADSTYQKQLATRSAGKTPKTPAAPKDTVVVDFGSGQSFAVPKSVLKNNLNRLYDAMIRENLNLAAPRVNTGRKDENLDDIWRDPTQNEKYEYLVRNINESPAAQRLLSAIFHQQGSLGLNGVQSQGSSSGSHASTDNTFTATDSFYQAFSGF